MGRTELERSLSTLDIWLIIFGVFVAIGVVGESIAGFLHWRRSGQLQMLQTTENLALQKAVAEANTRALDAQLALEKFKAPRTLRPDQQQEIGRRLKSFSGTEFDGAVGPKGDPEPIYLMHFISEALALADWKFVPWTGPGETLIEPPGSAIGPMAAIGSTAVTNVIIDVGSTHWQKYGTAATALAAALTDEGIAAIADSKPSSIDTDVIHIRIGRKQ
jgi:hypothetical protein